MNEMMALILVGSVGVCAGALIGGLLVHWAHLVVNRDNVTSAQKYSDHWYREWRALSKTLRDERARQQTDFACDPDWWKSGE